MHAPLAHARERPACPPSPFCFAAAGRSRSKKRDGDVERFAPLERVVQVTKQAHMQMPMVCLYIDNQTANVEDGVLGFVPLDSC
jgi:hypothetical protein